ncbi:DNA mismatch repair protein MSH5 [Geosmithia morbida]|uniref:DNA mismatch repair protein MSH5 n=1 Tax=Geosmithia morbida TaxID=1094350 RepID=A0A9P4YUI7_9HYPO|nr:DNA mismatch repair protein MSH5 [Geosmithia morbida]KAF4123351.1 DNA mismatch repair protein MSH5 [Geosmithia morbida]
MFVPNGLSSRHTHREQILQDTTASHAGIEDSVLEEVIMAIDMREKSTMGCAYFSTEDGILYMSENIPNASLDDIEQYVAHVNPTTVLVSGKAPEELLGPLERQANADGSDDTNFGAFILRALAASEFSNHTAHERLISLQLEATDTSRAVISTVEDSLDEDTMLGQEGSHESRHIKLIRCGTFVNLESNVAVNCAGAILGDLHRRRSIGQLPDGQFAEIVFHARSLKNFSASNGMIVNSETLQALRILQSEVHLNSHLWGSKPGGSEVKEKLSVYGMLHPLAYTPQGRSALRKILIRPTLDMDVLVERQATISFLQRPDNAEKVRLAGTVLKRVKNANFALSQLKRGVDSPSSGKSFDKGAWAILRDFASQALKLREIVGTMSGSESVVICHEVKNIRVRELMAIGSIIDKNIDFEQSDSRHRSSVKAGIDPRLDELKRRYDGMGSFLTEVVNSISRVVPEWAAQYIRSCIFLPQLGFLTVVEADHETRRGKYKGEGLGDDEWEGLFNADGKVCYKNKYMKELDDQYGDMYCEIGDREVEIVHELACNVITHEEAIIEASGLCGKLDALMALARGAAKYGWVCPQLTTTRILNIKGGRHPLQELCVPSFVPNDCYLGGGQRDDAEEASDQAPTALALTGPNHSGKSIYLKQVAIVVYLAHVGSFVPATQATIGLTDRIMTRMSTRESMSRPESAFSIDLGQVAHAMRTATRRSLVLIDEFGKGTNGQDGAGLLAATVDHFLNRGPESPFILLATHFHELFEGGYLDGYPGLGMAHMEVKTDWSASQTDKQITYLFQLRAGHSASSFGAQCAVLNGVPRVVVDRAEAITRLLARNGDVSVACARLPESEEKKLEEAEAVARLFLRANFSKDADYASTKETLMELVGSTM